ncbi:MAG: leucine-rich repeat protein [Paludibacteraceae bacterium]|nr:leucine-rich repeat protein [Paludibacteraceae bacterium]
MKKKIFTFFLALVAGTGTMFAEKVKIGDLYYNLDATNQTAEVTYKSHTNHRYNEDWNVTTANIPTSVTYNSVTYSVTSIGDFAFSRCSGLTSVTIPNSVTNIGNQAFNGCTGLTSVTIGNSVTSIGDFAFSRCSGLTSVTIPNSVTSIGDYAFAGCIGLTSIIVENGNSMYDSRNNCNAIIKTANNELILGCQNTIIPNSVTEIGDNAFADCSVLISVTIPNSVTSIGREAFYNCTSLTSVTIEAGTPPTIGEYCFYYTDTNPLNISVYVPCGTLDAYKNAAGWSDYASKIKYAPYPSYAITKKAENGHITTSSTGIFTMCDEHSVICTANPNSGCYFVRWADGSTENPRTIELTQDTTMEAIFDYLLTGKCGKDSTLTWTFEPASMALNITGKAALSENYTYGTFIESLTIGNEVTTIGEDAFYKCTNLKNVIIGSAVKVLEESAFYRCSAIETITCYGQRPPTVNQNALYGLDYSTIVYVPADYLNTYKMHDAWGLYDVRPLGAKSTETTDVNVTPAENTADVAWPAVSGAATYELVIKDKSGNVICTLVFNANGQLTSIAFAPSRNGAPQQTQAAGFSFTVTGLEEGTSYDLTITSKDNSGTTLDTKTISFTTSVEAPQGIDQVSSDQVQSTKVIKNGQVFILRGDKTYTLQGQEVK